MAEALMLSDEQAREFLAVAQRAARLWSLPPDVDPQDVVGRALASACGIPDAPPLGEGFGHWVCVRVRSARSATLAKRSALKRGACATVSLADEAHRRESEAVEHSRWSRSMAAGRPDEEDTGESRRRAKARAVRDEHGLLPYHVRALRGYLERETAKEVAGLLGLSVRTVNCYVKEAYDILGVRSIPRALVAAGIVVVPSA